MKKRSPLLIAGVAAAALGIVYLLRKKASAGSAYVPSGPITFNNAAPLPSWMPSEPVTVPSAPQTPSKPSILTPFAQQVGSAMYEAVEATAKFGNSILNPGLNYGAQAGNWLLNPYSDVAESKKDESIRLAAARNRLSAEQQAALYDFNKTRELIRGYTRAAQNARNTGQYDLANKYMLEAEKLDAAQQEILRAL